MTTILIIAAFFNGLVIGMAIGVNIGKKISEETNRGGE